MGRHCRWAVCVSLALGLTLAACAPAARHAHQPGPPGRWVRFRHLAGVVDLAGPRGDGSFVVAAAGRLFIWNPASGLRPFARGPGGYTTPIGPEPYITMPGDVRSTGAGCSWGAGSVFALQPGRSPGIVETDAAGRARRFAAFPATLTPSGITFDTTGHFGHNLLVTARGHEGTTVLVINCAGRVHAVTARAPAMEGGLSVAPASFGRYGGDLVAAGESSGRLFAIAPDGAVATLAASGQPRGGDIGVESTGFVPPGFGGGDAAYLADRYSKGNKHPGTNSILRLSGAELVKLGVRPGDLLAATEASARTIVVACGHRCTVRYIAIGPEVTHAEGHIAFSLVGR